jgi:uncharacterized protein with FMN-binding domain
MRRVILAVTGTIAGLVALLSFKAHAPTVPVASTSGTGGGSNTVYGPVQIELVVKSHKIVKVAVLEQPTNTIHDIQIGEFAFPKLISETLTAQNAKVDAVSGASYTSAGYISSLQSAVDHGL